jgi:hypothetical protein
VRTHYKPLWIKLPSRLPVGAEQYFCSAAAESLRSLGRHIGNSAAKSGCEAALSCHTAPAWAIFLLLDVILQLCICCSFWHCCIAADSHWAVHLLTPDEPCPPAPVFCRLQRCLCGSLRCCCPSLESSTTSSAHLLSHLKREWARRLCL